MRVRGGVIDLGPEASAADFAARPVGSRAPAMLGRQSDVLLGEAELDAALAESRRRFEAEPNAISNLWRVYAVNRTRSSSGRGQRAVGMSGSVTGARGTAFSVSGSGPDPRRHVRN